MARTKRNTPAGDDAILRGVSGVDDVKNCGLHIVPRLENRQEALEDRYTLPSVYDGTDLGKLIADEREMARKTELKFMPVKSFAKDVAGTIRFFVGERTISIAIKDGSTYVLGGSNLSVSPSLPPEVVLNGTLMLERNGRVAGVAIVGQKGKLVSIVKSDKPVWLAQSVPLGSAPTVVRL